MEKKNPYLEKKLWSFHDVYGSVMKPKTELILMAKAIGLKGYSKKSQNELTWLILDELKKQGKYTG